MCPTTSSFGRNSSYPSWSGSIQKAQSLPTAFLMIPKLVIIFISSLLFSYWKRKYLSPYSLKFLPPFIPVFFSYYFTSHQAPSVIFIPSFVELQGSYLSIDGPMAKETKRGEANLGPCISQFSIAAWNTWHNLQENRFILAYSSVVGCIQGRNGMEERHSRRKLLSPGWPTEQKEPVTRI